MKKSAPSLGMLHLSDFGSRIDREKQFYRVLILYRYRNVIYALLFQNTTMSNNNNNNNNHN